MRTLTRCCLAADLIDDLRLLAGVKVALDRLLLLRVVFAVVGCDSDKVAVVVVYDDRLEVVVALEIGDFDLVRCPLAEHALGGLLTLPPPTFLLFRAPPL